MAGKWSAMARSSRFLLVVVLLYLVEAVVITRTAWDRNTGYADVVIGAFTTAFGAGLAAAALRTDYLRALGLRWRLRRGAGRATATVAAVISFHNSEFTYPVFEYATPDGVTHRHGDASSRALAVGDTVDVRYPLAEADFAVGPLSGFNAMVFVFLGLLGTVLLAMMPIMTVQSLLN
ncbi:hypothetical protein GCM10009839_11850 [Catenulispora yoronensis]|uniref:DUF3592 domain-containing protein n=1 Tax=Catenulispora yoronensis TaxID=450799 RepID=A0ABP5F783_9ACTN